MYDDHQHPMPGKARFFACLPFPPPSPVGGSVNRPLVIPLPWPSPSKLLVGLPRSGLPSCRPFRGSWPAASTVQGIADPASVLPAVRCRFRSGGNCAGRGRPADGTPIVLPGDSSAAHIGGGTIPAVEDRMAEAAGRHPPARNPAPSPAASLSLVRAATLAGREPAATALR